jgi:hypothetical protein
MAEHKEVVSKVSCCNKKKPPITGSFQMQNEDQLLQLANILRRRTFGAGDNIEAYPIALGQ